MFFQKISAMENISDHQKTATPESVWAAFSVLTEKQAETDRLLKESSADFDRRMKEYDRRMKKFEEMNGGLSNNQGLFAEEYFFNAFENGKKNFFGEKFNDIERNLKGIESKFKDEYDIVFFNGKSIAIVEVKFRARNNNIEQLVNKAKTFKINFPKFRNHRIYLGLAALTFDNGIEEDCKEKGIAVVKQVGDTVVINDDHLNVF